MHKFFPRPRAAGVSPLRLGMLAVIFTLATPAAPLVHGDDGLGAFDGALWRFSLTPQFPKDREKAAAASVRGHFRVQNFEMFQSDSPEDRKDLSKKVGTSKPFGKAKKPTHTIVEVTEMRAWDKSRNKITLEGKGRLVRDEFGAGSGVFVTKDGTRWDMKITRFKE